MISISKTIRRHRTVLLVGGVAALALVLAGGLTISRKLPNFHTVRKGVLYRSGQPRGVGLGLVHLRGIKTLVNLRKPGRPGIAEEEAYANAHGMNFVQIPLGNATAEIQMAADQFLAIVRDPKNWPVLVHCSRGKERAGIMTAAFRIEEDGWSLDKVMAELFRLGLQPGAMPQAEAFVAGIAHGTVPQTTPAPQGKQTDWQD